MKGQAHATQQALAFLLKRTGKEAGTFAERQKTGVVRPGLSVSRINIARAWHNVNRLMSVRRLQSPLFADCVLPVAAAARNARSTPFPRLPPPSASDASRAQHHAGLAQRRALRCAALRRRGESVARRMHTTRSALHGNAAGMQKTPERRGLRRTRAGGLGAAFSAIAR